jgi:NADP-dependent aldehyde dehydrogenase
LLLLSAADLDETLAEECFGPVAVIARYRDLDELTVALGALPPSLTATLHTGNGETDIPALAAGLLRAKVGRFIYNGYPTGVAVSWAQHHGGPWPATNSLHTSVGSTAIRRFLRPMAWQNAPDAVLPEELLDGASAVPRRIDGSLVLPAAL